MAPRCVWRSPPESGTAESACEGPQWWRETSGSGWELGPVTVRRQWGQKETLAPVQALARTHHIAIPSETGSV